MDETVVYSGYLRKLNSKGKKWQNRWFVLHSDAKLRYFDKNTSSKAKAEIDLQQASKIQASTLEECPTEYVLDLETRKRNWHLCAQTATEINQWMDAIQDAMGSPSEEYRMKALFKSLDVDVKHVAAFLKEDIKIGDILKLPDAELKAMIPQAGPRNRLLHHLQKRGKDEVKEDTKKEPSFHALCLSGNVERITELLKLDQSLANMPNSDGSYPLHGALRGQHGEIVKILLDNSADITTKIEAIDYLPLSFACETSAISCIPLLIKAKADPNEIQDKAENLSLLHCASKENNFEVATLLLDYDADIYSVSKEGKTPLHYASQENSLNILKLLIHRGSQPNIRDERDDTPLHLATSEEGAVILVSNGARIGLSGDSSPYAGAEFDQIVLENAAKQFTKLSAAPDDLSATSKTDWTPDQDSSDCLICALRFTVAKRRHHCRRCGILCCGDCSTKKILFASATQKKKSMKGERACDGCFLLMHHRHLAKMEEFEEDVQSSTLAPSHQETKSEVEPEEKLSDLPLDRNSEAEPETHRKKSKFGTLRKLKPKKTKSNEASKQVDAEVLVAIEKSNESRALLHNNLEKLDQMQTSSSELANESQNFAKMAEALKNKSKGL